MHREATRAHSKVNRNRLEKDYPEIFYKISTDNESFIFSYIYSTILEKIHIFRQIFSIKEYYVL